MFTGVITDLGRVRAIAPGAPARLTVETGYDTARVAIGASIACAGPCLSVVDKGPGWFAVDVSAETLSCTTLGDWRVGRAGHPPRAAQGGAGRGGGVVSGP